MAYSTLYSIVRTGGEDGLVAVKEATKQLDESAPSSTAYVVGVLATGESVCHGQPGDAIPKGATVYYDGSKAWTWNALATKFPTLADVCAPHEWYGEFSAAALTTAKFLRYPKVLVIEKAVSV
ncbi:MAG: hypothetical protein WC700_14355 [Gemmatimonadaceae bacterium]|jgi:FAD/FMN-containing dehydrogenase